jgi:hypothetical protein
MREMLAASTWTPACTVGKCLAEVRAQTGAHFVVNAGLSGSGQSYRFTITVVATDTGDVIDQITEACPACTVDDLVSSATIATIGLMNAAPLAIAPDQPAGTLAERVRGLERRARSHKTTLRRTGVVVVGLAVLAGATAYYFVDKGQDDLGYALAGAAGGLATSGALMLGLSLRY